MIEPSKAGRWRVTVWGINYSPELIGIAPYNTALCQHLRREGCEVRMVTSFAYYPAWKKRPEDRGRLFRRDEIDGIAVYRCWHYVPAKVRTIGRIVHEGTFVAMSFLRQLFLPRPDLLVAVSPPLFLGVAAWMLGVLKGCPFVFHVQDLQPDAAASLGMVRRGLFLRLLYRLEAFAYTKAALVSGISGGMTEAFTRKGVPAAKLVYFPNGVRLGPRDGQPPAGMFRARLNLGADEFLAIYSGNLGVKQGLEVLVQAGRLVREKIRIIICGDGSQRPQLSELIREYGLQNVLLLPLQSEEGYREMLRDADVCLITQQRGTGQFFLPSKLLGILALSKPVLTVGDETSELVKAVREGGFGVNIPPEEPDKLAAALNEMALHPEQMASWGDAGRRYVERFDFEAVHARFMQDLPRALGPGRTGLAGPPPSPR